MENLSLITQILAAVAGGIAALGSILLFIRLRWPAPVLYILKLFASAASPWLALTGVLVATAGLITGSAVLGALGVYTALVYLVHIYLVTRPPDESGDFERAFEKDWENRLDPHQKNRFLPRRTVMTLPAVPEPRLHRNVSFAIVPGTGRQLLCDVWQPPESIPPSGLAFIYLHGGTWYLLDKDLGTRPMFRHLAAQGHVIMDVAYRLAPETDMMGMVHDVRRSIVWMKENAATYGVHPDRIVLGGGSAGAHLALLAAYTAHDPRFIPEGDGGRDAGVCAVVSAYGPADLEACYYHTNQHLTTRSTPDRPGKGVPAKMPAWIIKLMGRDYHRLGMDKDIANAGALAPLLGGRPDECPEIYALYSPVTHVQPASPPTLLLQGEHDLIAPVKAAHSLHARLVKGKVPTVAHFIPQTDHAFDLILPGVSPSSHNALYDLERFLALMVNQGHQPGPLILSKEKEPKVARSSYKRQS
jgi:acetyl esterase/lipase